MVVDVKQATKIIDLQIIKRRMIGAVVRKRNVETEYSRCNFSSE